MIKAIEWNSPEEKRIGKHPSNGLKGTPPTVDIFGTPVRRPFNTYPVAGSDVLYVVLPHRALNDDEWAEVNKAVENAAPIPVSVAETPNGSELNQTNSQSGINTDQSAEFAPTPPVAEPPINYVGDGSVPVSDGEPLPHSKKFK